MLCRWHLLHFMSRQLPLYRFAAICLYRPALPPVAACHRHGLGHMPLAGWHYLIAVSAHIDTERPPADCFDFRFPLPMGTATADCLAALSIERRR